MTFLQNIIAGLQLAQLDNNNPTFAWNSGNYPCMASVTELRRMLERGGFVDDKLLTLSVQLQDGNGNYTFPANILPDTQQVITYQGLAYRIQTKKLHPSGAYVRYTAICTTHGI